MTLCEIKRYSPPAPHWTILASWVTGAACSLPWQCQDHVAWCDTEPQRNLDSPEGSSWMDIRAEELSLQLVLDVQGTANELPSMRGKTSS